MRSVLAYNFVLNTPVDFVYVLLDKWISPKDLVNLDTAFCTHACRPDFLDLLKAHEFIISSSKSNPLRMYGLFCDWILKRQVKLSHIDLGHGSNPVDMLKIENFISYCAPNLQSIAIVALRLSVISDDGYDQVFDIIAKHCHRLKSIAVQAGHLPVVFSTILINNSKRLRKLDIAANKWSIDLTQDLHFPELTELRLGKAGDMRGIDTDGQKSLEYFAMRSPKLSMVSLEKAYIHEAGLAVLTKHSKELKEISLEWTEANTPSIVDHCPRTVAIRIQSSDKLDPSLRMFLCGLDLKEVELNGTDIPFHAFNSMCLHNPFLSRLKLTRCRIMGTISGFVFNHWSILEALDVPRCHFESFIHLFGLFKLCQNLTRLNLDGVNIDDSVLLHIGKRLPHLQYIILNTRTNYKNVSFTESGLKNLIQGCRQLKSVALFDAPPAVVALLGTKLA